jgi:hypothetical protein
MHPGQVMIDIHHPAIPYALALVLYIWGAYGFGRQDDIWMAWTTAMYASANVGFIGKALKNTPLFL